MNTDTNHTKHVKIGQAAKILGVSIDTVRRWSDSGKLGFVRTPGGTRLYDPARLNLSQKEDNRLPEYAPPAPTEKWISPVETQSEAVVESVSFVAPKGTILKKVFLSSAVAVITLVMGLSALVLGAGFFSSKPQVAGPALQAALGKSATSGEVLAIASPSGQYLEVNKDLVLNGSLLGSSVNVADITGTTLTLTSVPQFIQPSGNKIILPDANGTIALTDNTQTLTNKTISGSSNTFSNIPNSALSNSKVTITAGTNMSGGGDVNLGSSVTLNLASTVSITTLTVSGTTSFNGITYTWPSAQGVANSTLTNDGTGTLSWVTPSGGSGVLGYWQRTSGSLAPTNISDSINIGATATASALVHLAGTSGENSFFNTGYVGIGTTNPGMSLDILGTSNVGMRYMRTVAGQKALFETVDGPDANNGSYILFGDDPTGSNVGYATGGHFLSAGHNGTGTARDLIIQNYDANNIVFVTGGGFASNERMRITGTGNVGIGMTAPAAKLDIGTGTTNGINIATITANNQRGVNITGSANVGNDQVYGVYTTMDTSTGTTNSGYRYGYGVFNQLNETADGPSFFGNFNFANLYGLYNNFDLSHNVTGIIASTFDYGIYNTSGGVYTGNGHSIRGIQNSFKLGGSGTIGYGVENDLSLNSTDGISQTAYGFYTLLNEIGAGDIFYANNIAGTVNAGTAYGMYINLTGSSTTKYGIYETGGATNYFAGNVGIGTTSPSSIFSVGSSSQLQVNATGNIVKLNNVTTSFPASQGSANSTLTNDGSGNLTWNNPSGGTGILGYWQRTSGSLAPTNITDSINIGATATSSAFVHLAGTSGENSFFNTGNVGIGTTAPASTLQVIGGITSGLGLTHYEGFGGDVNAPALASGDIKAQAIRDAQSWMQNQGGETKLQLGYNNGGLGGGATPGNLPLTSGNASVFDTGTVNSNSKGFKGAVFDGRYVYFVPFQNAGGKSGQVTRYDTSSSFTSTSSYAVFDTTTVNSNSKGFFGGVFDGRYVYFVPQANSVAQSGQVTRYDTTGSFTSASSWSVFDTSTVNAGSIGFNGAIFDGRYIYLVPVFNTAYDGQVTRYDTTASFTVVGSWSVYDTSLVNARSKGFVGATFDGRYIYYVPFYDNTQTSGQVTRFDTTGSFTSAGSYSVYDMANVNTNAKGFQGAVFDGRYVYYVPNSNGITSSGLVARYDTSASFTSASSYAVFDMSTVNAASIGFSGGVYDGRYVYFVPYDNGGGKMITRYDTTGSFTSSSSYSVLDATTVGANAQGFIGATFDGHYVYMMTNNNGVAYNGIVARVQGWAGGIDSTMALAKIARGSDFYITSSGNVGIGTTAPIALLDVRGTATISGNLTVAGNILPAVDNTYSLGSSPSARWKSLFLGPGSLHIQSLSTDTGYPALGLDYAMGINTAGSLQNSLNGTALTTLKANGMFGIGTTNPGYTLDVNGNTNITGTLTVGGLTSSSASTSGALTLANPSSTDLIKILNGQRLDFQTSVGGDAGLASVMTILNNGNVGIGTTAPLALLAVGSGSVANSVVPVQINAASSSVAYYGANKGGVLGGIFGFANNADGGGGVTTAMIIRTLSPDPIDFIVNNGTKAVRIDSAGNVGIGTTSPLATLDVRGNSGTIPVASISGTTAFPSLVVDQRGSGAIFTASVAGLPKFIIDNGGNVGIGTTAPANLLSVGSSSQFQVGTDGRITNNTNYLFWASGPANTLLLGDNGGNWQIAYQTAAIGGRVAVGLSLDPATVGSRLSVVPTASQVGLAIRGAAAQTADLFQVQNNTPTTLFDITAAGNVGIGTTAPGALLDLAGNATMSGNLTFRSASTIATTAKQSLTLGDANTGNINFFGTSNYITSAGNLVLAGALTTSGSASMSGALTLTSVPTIQSTSMQTLTLGSATTGNIAFAPAGTTAMTVANGGNVGIGITNPAFMFQVSGNTAGGTALTRIVNAGQGDFADYVVNSAGGVGHDLLNIWEGATRKWRIGYHDTTVVAGSGPGAFRIYDDAAGFNAFMIDNSAQGKIGIGAAVAVPLAQLDVRGVSGTIPVASISGTTAYPSLVVDQRGSGAIFTASVAGLPKFIIDNGGNVGIGTTTPNYPLDVIKSGISTIHLSTSGDSGGYITSLNSTNVAFSGGSTFTGASWLAKATSASIMANSAYIAGDWAIFTDTGLTAGNTYSPTPRFIVTNAGNVGIGTTAPGALLDLAGNATMSGNLTFRSASTIATTAKQSLTLGDANTGNINFYSSTNSLTSGGNLTLGGFASISGALTLTTTPTIGTTSMQTLTLGGATTGSVQLSPKSTTGLFVDGTGNVGIGTTSPAVNLAVAGKFTTLNSGKDASVGTVSTTTSLPEVLWAHMTVTANGYIYIMGGNNGPGNIATVRYAKVNGDGSLGNWTTTTSLPTAVGVGSSVTANGYIYVIGGADGGFVARNYVYYGKVNADGTISSWKSTTGMPAALANLNAVTANGYIYAIGGGTTSVYYTKMNPDGTVGAWGTANALPSLRGDAGVVVANGYIYVMGGENAGAQTTVYYARLNIDGTISAWNTTTALPVTLEYQSAVAFNGYLYNIGGYNPGCCSRDVIYAPLNSDGTVGAWTTLSNQFPAAKGGANRSGVILNGYFYALGGWSTGWVLQTTGFYGSFARVQIAGNLDLLGLTSQFLSSASGQVGGSINAGSIFSNGNLDITGNSQLWNGLSVLNGISSQGQLTVASGLGTVPTASISGATSMAALVVDNSGSGDIFTASIAGLPKFVITNSGNVGVGTATPGKALDVVGTIRSTGGADGYLVADGTAGGEVMISKSGTNKWALGTDVGAATDNLNIYNYNTTSINFTILNSNGFVGIGTTNPGFSLDVENSQAATAAAMIYNTSTNADADGLIIRLGERTTSPANTHRFVSFEMGDGSYEKLIGSITGNGAGAVAYNTSAVDLAEYFKIDSSVSKSDFAPGMVVCQGLNGARPCNAADSSNILGVVSSNPGFVGGSDGPDKILLGLIGQLPVNIAADSQPIASGDMLTMAGNGQVKKAVSGQYTLGKALEDWAPGSKNQALAMINQGIKLDNLASDISKQLSLIPQIQSDVASLKAEMASVSGRLANVENKIASPSATPALADQSNWSNLNISTISAEFANFSDSLKVIGKTQLADTTIGGKLTIGLVSIDDMTGDISGLNGLLTLQNGSVKIDSAGGIIARSVRVEELKVLGARTAGRIAIPAGQVVATVNPDSISDTDLIFVTPDLPVAVSAKKVGSNSAEVRLSAPATQSINVNWWIVRH